MELWIKSQDKLNLIPIHDTLHVKYSQYIDHITEPYEIYSIWYKDEPIGDYKTKERALEILDEIQNLLKQEEMLHINKSLLNDLDDIEEPKYILRPVYQPRVYEMPKK